jgi:hypothetical protein
MLARKPLVAIGVGVGFGVLCTQIAACSSSSSPADMPASLKPDSQTVEALPVCKAGGLTIAFNPMYSAFDGTHMFQIPAAVHGSNSEVTWSWDTSMVGVQAYAEAPNEIMITVLKAGTTTIVAQSADGKCGSSPLSITAAHESDWEIGNARYNDGHSLHLAAGAVAGTGSPLEQSNTGMVMPACTNCHGETATGGPFTDVSHTPEQTGGFSDSDLLNIILRGTFPPGAYFDNSIVAYPVWQTWHKWADITPDEQPGIIVYLRSLTPAPQKGAPNFGYPTDAGSGGGVSTEASSEGGGADGPSGAGDAPGGDGEPEAQASDP